VAGTAALTGDENGAGDRDRTGDIQLGNLTDQLFRMQQQ
jgi:hypothetical protein